MLIILRALHLDYANYSWTIFLALKEQLDHLPLNTSTCLEAQIFIHKIIVP